MTFGYKIKLGLGLYHHNSFHKGVATHSTIENNDGGQETMTGLGTTHDKENNVSVTDKRKRRKSYYIC